MIVRDGIDENAGKTWGNLREASSLARIIWNLVNLGYADSDYSISEKRIVEYLLDKWLVPREIYMEFVDTAETILALIKQKEWMQKTYKAGGERDEKERSIDNDIEKMKKDVNLTIKELGL